MNTIETLDYIIKNKSSVARFGDGEFIIMLKKGSLGFQVADDKLSCELSKVIEDCSNNCLLCVPGFFVNMSNLCPVAYSFWYEFRVFNHIPIIKLLKKFKKGNYYFGNTQISRPYLDYIDKSHCDIVFSKIKSIFLERNILIVEGSKTRLGVGNDLLDNSKSIRRILVPERNAFSIYDNIYSRIKLEYHKNDLILLAIGPTATVLANDLAKMGIQAIDIGHIDIEYEWYKRKAEIKVQIPGKFTNEVNANVIIGSCSDSKYQSEIICNLA